MPHQHTHKITSKPQNGREAGERAQAVPRGSASQTASAPGATPRGKNGTPNPAQIRRELSRQNRWDRWRKTPVMPREEEGTYQSFGL